MTMGNSTQVKEFVFSGLTSNEKLIPFFFAFFLMVYLVTVLGNLGLIVLVSVASNLHTPMYYFLSCLSAIDLFYSTAVTPKTLFDLTSLRKTISFNGCASQFFFFAALAGTELLLLSSMSYDRYAAICHPLHYVSIMTKSKCLSLAGLSFSFGFLQSAVQTGCLFSLQYCGSNVIDHFYCDIPPILSLSCSSTLLCNLLTTVFVGTYGLYSLSAILVSYALIFTTILRIKSSEGRQKAFSTCSHLMCSSIFYIAIFYTYLHSPSSSLKKQDKVASVLYSLVTPMLNPLIYSFRNQEVKRAIVQAMHAVYLVIKML